jgi:hypothetical protein
VENSEVRKKRASGSGLMQVNNGCGETMGERKVKNELLVGGGSGQASKTTEGEGASL